MQLSSSDFLNISLIRQVFSEAPWSYRAEQRITMPENTGELGRIDLGDITPHNIKLLRKVNTVVFPVSYHDKFYKVRGHF